MKRRRSEPEKILIELNKQEAILNEITRTLKRIKCTHKKNKFTCAICNEIPLVESKDDNSNANGYANLIKAIEINYLETDTRPKTEEVFEKRSSDYIYDICIHGYSQSFCGDCEIMSRIVSSFCRTSEIKY